MTAKIIIRKVEGEVYNGRIRQITLPLISYDCCNKLSPTRWFQTTGIYSLIALEASSPKSVLLTGKSRCWRGYAPSWGIRGRICSLSLLFSGTCWCTLGLWLHHSSLCLHLLCLCEMKTLLPSVKDICDYIWILTR